MCRLPFYAVLDILRPVYRGNCTLSKQNNEHFLCMERKPERKKRVRAVDVMDYDLHEEIEAAYCSPENRYTHKMNLTATISELKRTVLEMITTSSMPKRERLYVQSQERNDRESLCRW